MRDSLIPYQAPSRVRDLISTIGRSEDIRLSPDNQRLAIAAYDKNEIYLISIQIADSASGPEVQLSNCLVLRSDHLIKPHGLSFLNNEQLIVASRFGSVSVFDLPPVVENRTEHAVDPTYTLRGRFWSKIETPGSVDCYMRDDGVQVVLVCNNFLHKVTSHELKSGNRFRVRNNKVLIRKGLTIPDGVSVSRDRQWIAISQHVIGEVWIYNNQVSLNRHSSPVGILHGSVCPHGLRFTPDGGQIWLADSASPFIHYYERSGDSWSTAQDPTRSIRVLDEREFALGRINRQEGGPKGLEINNSASVVMTTSEHQVLAFFDLRKLIREPGYRAPDEELSQLCSERDQHYKEHPLRKRSKRDRR